MKFWAMTVGGAVAILLIAGLFFYQFFPGSMLAMVQSSAASKSGLTKEVVDLDGYAAAYYAGGPETGETVVLLHGLTDNKNSFVASVEEITQTHRVILPDLQGHGENAGLASRDNSIKGQSEFIAALLDEIGVRDVIIGGNSMGGHTAASFALNHPDRVKGLIIVNATGVWEDRPSTYFKYESTVDVQYMRDLYDRYFYNPPSIPGPIMRYLAKDLNDRIPFYNVLVGQVTEGEDFRLDEKLETATVPTLILWGRHDALLPEIWANGYDTAISNSTLIFFEAGHAPQIEVPAEIGEAMEAFITSLVE